MKKYLVLLSVCLFLNSCSNIDNNKQYVTDDFIACTALKESYTIIKSEFKRNQVCTIAEISANDKKRLLSRFKYIPVDSLSSRETGYIFISERLYKFTDEYVYYLTDYEVLGRPAQHAYKKDGYYILGVSKTKNEIVFCENFPELPLSPF